MRWRWVVGTDVSCDACSLCRWCTRCDKTEQQHIRDDPLLLRYRESRILPKACYGRKWFKWPGSLFYVLQIRFVWDFFHETNMLLFSVLGSQSSHYKHLQVDPCVTFSWGMWMNVCSLLRWEQKADWSNDSHCEAMSWLGLLMEHAWGVTNTEGSRMAPSAESPLMHGW